MDRPRTTWQVALACAALTALAACGGGGTGDYADIRIGVYQINGPFPADTPTPFVLEGDFSHLTGVAVAVRFEALEGEPFQAGQGPNDTGRAATRDVPATITSDRTIEGLSPLAFACGPSAVEAWVWVLIHGGPATRSSEPIARFEGPTVLGLSIEEAGAAQPETVEIAVSLIAENPGPLTVHWRSDAEILGLAQTTEATTAAVRVDEDTLTTVTPVAVLCGSPARIEIDHVELGPERCIAGGGFGITLQPAQVTSLANAAPAEETPRAGSITFAGAVSDPVEIRGAGFGPVGGIAQLRFRAAEGTPFVGGSAAEVDVPGAILAPDRIEAASPFVQVCDVPVLLATVEVLLPGGGCAGPALTVTFHAPTVDTVDDGAGGTAFTAFGGESFAIAGSDFGPVGGVASVRFASKATGDGSTPFGGGTSADVSVAGLIVERTKIAGVMPAAMLCPSDTTSAGAHALSIGSTVTVTLPSGACAPAFDGVTFDGPSLSTFDGVAPTAKAEVPSTVRFGAGGQADAFRIEGAGFGPVGSSAVVTFEDTSGGTPFGGSAQALVVATVVGADAVEGRLPVFASPRLASDVTVRVRVTQIGGSCAFANDLVTFLAPPTIITIGADPAVAGETGAAFLSRCTTLMRVDGQAFDAGATHAILAADDGTPIGSGTLVEPTVQADGLLGASPVDAGLAAAEYARVRVVNEDDQYHEAGLSGLRFLVDGRTEVRNASRRSGDHAGMACALDPLDPRRMVVLSHEEDAGGEGLVLLRSTDAGATWSAVPIGDGHDGRGAVPRRDGRVAFDRFGHLHLAWVAGGATETLVCAQSDDAGATLAVVREVASDAGGGLLDPFLAVGPDATDGDNEVVCLGWTDTGTFGTGPASLVVAASRVAGASATSEAFGAPVQVSDLLTTAARGDAAFTTAGALHVVFHDETLDVGSGPLRLFHDRDADGPYGTAGFGTDAPVAVLALGARESVTPQPDRGVGPGTQVATVRAGPFAGRVVVLYADETADGSGDLDVFARVSDDQGTTWSVATRVNDDGGSSAQILPALASDSDSGDLAACWLDPRSDGSGRAVRAHAAVSTDGGATWSANLALTGSPSDEDDLDADREYGDRLGLAGHGGCWFAAWADASDATQDNPGGQATTAAYVARFQRR